MGEVDRLLDQVDVGHTGHVAKGQLAASQIDWATLQRDRDAWLRCVRRAFEEFDADHDGVCGLDEIVACLKAKLPLTEVIAQTTFACCLRLCVMPECQWCRHGCPLLTALAVYQAKDW